MAIGTVTKIKCDSCGMAGGKHSPECPQSPAGNQVGNENAARDEAAARKTEGAAIGTFFKVKVAQTDLDAFVRLINEGFFAGETQNQVQCEFQQPGAEGGIVRCSNVAPPAMVKKVVAHCPTCDRDQKKSVLKLCVGHAILVWGGGHPSSAQTEMELETE